MLNVFYGMLAYAVFWALIALVCSLLELGLWPFSMNLFGQKKDEIFFKVNNILLKLEMLKNKYNFFYIT